MDVEWIRREKEAQGRTWAEIAAAAQLDPPAMSKVISGNRQLKSSEADRIRRFFGYIVPGDPELTEEEQQISEFLRGRSADERKRALELLRLVLGDDRRPLFRHDDNG